MILDPSRKKWDGILPLPSQSKDQPQKQQQAGRRGVRGHTGLLELGDVQQSPVLGAAEGLFKALQAQGKLLLSGGWSAGLQSFLEPLCKSCCTT